MLDRLVEVPLVRWWLRDPVERAAVRLCGAYLLRDRDVKLRVYPGAEHPHTAQQPEPLGVYAPKKKGK